MESKPTNPRTNANIISVLFFWWVNPIIKLGYRRDLKEDDLYQVTPTDESQVLRLRLEVEWQKELDKLNESKKGTPSLTRALMRAFGKEFWLLALAAFLQHFILKIAQPLCLWQLIRYFHPDGEMSTLSAYLYATGLVMAGALGVFTQHLYFFYGCLLGMQLRVASCSLMYQKCLKLSREALGQTSLGQMVNIMSNDVNRFDLVVVNANYYWIGPLQTAITTVILIFVIGPSCLVGLVIFLLFIPFQSCLLGRVFSRLRLKTAKKTDERVQLMNEILSGMRLIKMYTWEKPFAKLIEKCRRVEVNVIRHTAYYRALNHSLFFSLLKFIVFLTFVVYVLTGNVLTADKVFLTVALFNNIRNVMTVGFLWAIGSVAEARVSIKRIQNLLLLDEKTESREQFPRDSCLIRCRNVTVKWPGTSAHENTLTSISFTIHPGQILAIVGQVGSGKSSLLNVILKELPLLQGSVQVQGRVSYASQEPWIFSGSIRQNILCGLDYDSDRYRNVVQVTALEMDLLLFPHGDGTAVGEKGVQLSGGQKARISLARCLYVDADIYLMDDPLSAVDTHVGRHLFDQAIKGFLKGKIRVLVTHQLQYLKEVDEILVLKGGKVEALGAFSELISKDGLDIAANIGAPEEDGCSDDKNITTEVFHMERAATFPENKPQEMSEEARKKGNVTWSTYWNYFHSGGGYVSFFFLVFSLLICQVLFSVSDFWLSIWTNAEQRRVDLSNSSLASNSSSWTDEVDTYTGIYVYSGLMGGLFIFSMICPTHFFIVCLLSSVRLHNRMFHSIIRSPVSFFDRNPVGRILNRFSKDIDCIDDQLPKNFFDVLTGSLNTLGVIIVVAIVNPWLLLPVVFLTFIFYWFRRVYLTAARDIKRLEATTRSPIFSHLSTSLIGLTTVRARRCESIFQAIFDQCLNAHTSAWSMFIATSRWFAAWLEWICVVYLACIAYTCVAIHDKVNSSEVGLAISSALALAGIFQLIVRQSADAENQMTSVERVIEYGKLPSEAPLECSSKDRKPQPSWPVEGVIRFDNLSLRYNETDGPVLKDITCLIKSKEKIGIVGRTGAGKSSLIAALFRLTEPDGKILIDGIDTKAIGLHDLRSKISIIPQDPFLFSGTLRRNLDPFGEYDDAVIWSALESAKFKESMVESSSTGLDMLITEGGTNFSVGQRQLVCLARAMLRKNRILVLDEATANIDQKTDSLIQEAIREKFQDCTVLTIAHRLHTIMDSDKVMVMDAGQLIEFDEPIVLLKNPRSVFYGLVGEMGTTGALELFNLAKQAAEQRQKQWKNRPANNPSELPPQKQGYPTPHFPSSCYSNEAFDEYSSTYF